jgi:Fic family protein
MYSANFAANIVVVFAVKLTRKPECTMNLKDSFEFLNSDLWLSYTQARYLTPEEIRYRLQQKGERLTDWESTAKQFVATRKTGAVTLFLKSVEPRFWFYPADVIQKKIDEIERLGKKLYETINRNAAFKTDFLLDSTIEEAITSAIYEGAHSTRAQAQQLIASGERPKNKDEWMLVNNFRAMRWIQGNRNKPLSREVVLHLHKLVTENTLEGDDINFCGKFRNDKVYIGPHEGVDHRLIESAVDEMLELTTNNRRYFHPLVKGILIHYFIGYIHPFFDGNGRTARALFYYKAMRSELNYVELLSVSAYLKEHGKQYEKAFQKVKENDYDITYFIDFCLDSMASALKEVSRKVGYLLRLMDLKERFELSSQQVGLLQRMALHKFRTIDAEEYAQQISKSREFARQELKQLLELGFVNESKTGKKLVYKVNAERLKELYQSGPDQTGQQSDDPGSHDKA